ncbi:acyl-CoA N-acyltransferase [Phlebopus sp. FC_14]|nr:acyl-CoA N-acyltransferase [Phlebopus sp. FC_14]
MSLEQDTSSPIPPAHEIVLVPPPGNQHRQHLLDQCINVRIDVFVHEQGFPLDVEVDANRHDPTAAHFLLRLVPSLTPIGTIRAHKVEGTDYYKLSRLAILKLYRRYHLGRDLVLALHEWVKGDAMQSGQLEVAKVVCHSQIAVKPFYSKYGYQPQGDEFDEDGGPHQKMVAYLPLRS